jgi:anti-sigma regulatory factor (Ser/Thr protein kinase)
MTMSKAAWRFRSVDVGAALLRREAFVRALRRRAGASSDLFGAELIYGELLTNALRHGRGPVDVRLQYDGGRALLTVIDMSTERLTFSEPHGDPLSENGRGLFLARVLSRGFEVDYGNLGKRIQVVLPVELRS